MSGATDTDKNSAKVSKGFQNDGKTPPELEPSGLTPKKQRQEVFLRALPKYRYHIGKACDEAHVTRTTFHNWRTEPGFESAYQDVLQQRIDDLENAFLKNVQAGDSSCIIFGLKTLAKERGFNERETANTKTVKILEEVLAERMSVREAAFEYAKLGLPLPEVLKIELSKAEPEPPPPASPVSPEDLEKRYQEAMAERERQVSQFLPERQREVSELKDDLKGASSFDPAEEIAKG